MSATTYAIKCGAWVIKCDDYEVMCKTREQAERRLAGIESLGACANEHTIEER